MHLWLTSSRSARSSIFVGMVRDDAVPAPAVGGGINRLMLMRTWRVKRMPLLLYLRTRPRWVRSRLWRTVHKRQAPRGCTNTARGLVSPLLGKTCNAPMPSYTYNALIMAGGP
eukprot:scaffold1337_cov105-Skeletonema_marinoi.AAC.1